MRFKIYLILFFFCLSCSPQLTTLNLKNPYTSKGFAYIYNDIDFENETIKGKMNNETLQISHQNLKTGTLIKIINPKNKESIVLKNVKRIKYPDFYKILISEPVAKKLNLSLDFPFLEIIEIRKNKSFVAKKAKIYNEEKKIPSKAPVASVKISNISKNKSKETPSFADEIFIHIASFYSLDTAKFLRQRILKELPEINKKNIKIKKINNKETQVISGPYISVNLLKNDYIKLKNYGFEELDILIND
jgi:rare lipoprotein A (peptidoglycan hydrolase)